MRKTPRGLRLHIGIFGRRNVGKSSLLNALTRQSVSIVSDVPGTTTDPVGKPMEMLPLGPVLFIDTAGIDDEGALGSLRVEKTRRAFDRTDIAILVSRADEWGAFEDELLREFEARQLGVIVVFNKCDLATPDPVMLGKLDEQKILHVQTTANRGEGVLDVREALIQAAPDDWINTPTIMGDLIPPGELVILVTPIDKEAPKGRLILPQVQTIRDLLDHGSYCMCVREFELKDALARLNKPPAMVVTDSQAFEKVSADTPLDVPLTSFSILFARLKGDVTEFARGAAAIASLKPGDDILIAESCSHHPIADDIGREKIPRWLQEFVGGELRFTHVQGHDFPVDTGEYKLVIQCGACVTNRREILSRILQCRRAGTPITNYGMAIAYSLRTFDRALAPFPEALKAHLDMQESVEAT